MVPNYVVFESELTKHSKKREGSGGVVSRPSAT